MSKSKQYHDPDITYILPLTASPYMFVGEKPVAVMFSDKGEEESIDVKSWREVYTVILKRCNANPQYHETLMYLRGKVAGKCRVFLSERPAGMIRPIQIDDCMYGETHYGSATLMHILINRILAYVGFDCYNVSLVLKRK